MSITGMGYGLPSNGLYGPQSQLDASLSNLGPSGASSPLGGTSALYSNPMSGLYDATGGSGLSGGGGNMMGMVMQILSLLESMLSMFMGGGAGSANPQSLLASPSGATGTSGTTGAAGNGSDAGNPASTAPAADSTDGAEGTDPAEDPTGDAGNTGTGNDDAGCHQGNANPSADPTGNAGNTNPNEDPTGDAGNTDSTGDPTGEPGGNTPPNTVNLSVNTSAGGAGGGGSTPSKTGNADMDRWDPQIEAAAKSTGLPANYIKATIWAESRGNPNDPSQNPDGQHTDEGVMQISDYTYGDVSSNQPNAPKGLTAGNPADNIMMGAWELKDKSEKAGGDLHATSVAYVGHGDGSDNTYADNVMMYMNELNNNQPLTDN